MPDSNRDSIYKNANKARQNHVAEGEEHPTVAAQNRIREAQQSGASQEDLDEMQAELERMTREQMGDPEPEAAAEEEEDGEPEESASSEEGAETKEGGEIPPESASETEELVTIRVDGVEHTVKKSEIEERGGIANYQKSLAADARLQQATIARRQAEAQLAEIEEQKRQLSATPPQQSQPPGDQPPATGVDQGVESDDEAIEQLATEIAKGFMEAGSEDDFKPLVAKIIAAAKAREPARTQNEPVDPTAIAETVRQQLQSDQAAERLSRINAEREAADEIFKAEFSEIIEHPLTRDVVQFRINNAFNDPASHDQNQIELARQIGRGVKEEFAIVLNPDKAELEARDNAKRAQPAATQRAVTREPPDPEPQPTPRRAAFESIAKARGQL